METTGTTLEKQGTTQAICRHHWVIDSPSGPISRGVCKICGAVKQFQNYQFDFFWEDDVAAQASSVSSAGTAEAVEGEEEAA